jgi:hypothetical protein
MNPQPKICLNSKQIWTKNSKGMSKSKSKFDKVMKKIKGETKSKVKFITKQQQQRQINKVGIQKSKGKGETEIFLKSSPFSQQPPLVSSITTFFSIRPTKVSSKT